MSGATFSERADSASERMRKAFNELMRTGGYPTRDGEEHDVSKRMTAEQTDAMVDAFPAMGDFVPKTEVAVIDDPERGDHLNAVAEAWDTHAPLIRVLVAALAQSATGKGLERHGTLAPDFHDQPIHRIADLLGEHGYVGHLFQASKKISEANAMLDNDVPEARNRAIRELLGAIVYLAAAADRIGGCR